MAIGASFGRVVGILVQALYEAYPDSSFFAACEPDVPCITPGTYAFLGAGAALSGIMHITVSVVVIMFELTGALTYILPTMIVVGVTKSVAERFGRGGIADRMIWFNGFPFLDNKEDHSLGVPVSRAMLPLKHIVALPATGTKLLEVERLLANLNYQGFPIVEDRESNVLLGYIGRTELRYAVDRARRDTFVPLDATCIFAKTAEPKRLGSGLGILGTDQGQENGNMTTISPATPSLNVTFDPIASSSSARPSLSRTQTLSPIAGMSQSQFDLPSRQQSYSPSASTTPTASTGPPAILDLHRFPDFTPLAVHPSLPLETTMELFKKLGPRVILVELHGKLVGLVTVKDCLRFQFKAEAEEARRNKLAANKGGAPAGADVDMDARGEEPGSFREMEEEEARMIAEREEWLWNWIVKSAGWVNGKVKRWTKGRIVLGEPGMGYVPVDSRTRRSRRADGIPAEDVAGFRVDELGRVVRTSEDERHHERDASLELEERFPGGGTGSS